MPRAGVARVFTPGPTLAKRALPTAMPPLATLLASLLSSASATALPLAGLRSLIVGGGPSGLLLAHRLLDAGGSVSLLEGRPDPRTPGYLEGRAYALGLGLRGRAAIRTADEALWQAVAATGFPSDRFTLHLGSRLKVGLRTHERTPSPGPKPEPYPEPDPRSTCARPTTPTPSRPSSSTRATSAPRCSTRCSDAVCRTGFEPRTSRPRAGLLLTHLSLALDRRRERPPRHGLRRTRHLVRPGVRQRHLRRRGGGGADGVRGYGGRLRRRQLGGEARHRSGCARLPLRHHAAARQPQGRAARPTYYLLLTTTFLRTTHLLPQGRAARCDAERPQRGRGASRAWLSCD